MISPNAEPIAHISPYRRIELGSRDKKPEPKWVAAAEPVVSPYDQLFREILTPPIEDIYCG